MDEMIQVIYFFLLTRLESVFTLYLGRQSTILDPSLLGTIEHEEVNSLNKHF